jgi:iron complex transport system substrate-binding protein
MDRRSALLGAAALFSWPIANAAKPERLISVGGAITEILYALQAQANLVGVDTTSIYPEAATRLPSVGYARTLSLEGVLALAPTLILATEDAGPPAVMRQLSASGIPVAVLAANHRFKGMLDRIKRVGELTGRTAQALSLQKTLQQDWDRAQGAVQARMQAPASAGSARPVRVLFVLAHAPGQIMVAGSGTSAEAMLRYAGAINAVEGVSGFMPLTPEAVIAARPDVVLLTDQGLKAAGGVDGILKLPGLRQTPAGQAQRVMALEAMFLLGFGPRMPAALRALDAALTQALRA